jgi:hypothetical protein
MAIDQFGRLQEDAQFRNDLLNAKTQEDLFAASQRLKARAGVQSATEQPRSVDGRFVAQQDDATHTFQHTIEIAGHPVNIEASSAEELEKMISAAMQAAELLTAGPQKTQEQLEAEAVARAAAQANLELEFKRGDIDAATYLKESGAVSDWLVEQGIDINQLRQDSQEKEEAATVQSWAQATATFLEKSDWPGGVRNQRQMETMLAALDLIDADDKLGALAAAWAKMKAEGTFFPYEDPATAGVQVANERTNPNDIARPAEILEQWKRANLDATGSAEKANAAFIEAFRRRG